MDCLNNQPSEQYESGEKRRIFAQLTDLLHFSQYYLTQVPNVNKQLWTYTQGLIHLAMIFHFSSFDQYTRQRKMWFEQMGVTPTTYKFSHINQHNTVYIKSPAEVTTTSHKFIQRQMFYIGSTKVDLCHREYNRHTQLNRYKQGKAIQVELAIRWWASQNNYSQFTTIAIKQFSTYAEAWTYEHAVIQQLEAPLNFPLVARFLTRNAFRYFYKPDKRSIQGINSRYRLFARFRRRLNTKDKDYHTLAELRMDTWKIMYNLASFTKQRFETSKQLGSGAYTNTMIYSFIRLTSYIEEPERSRIRSELKRIAKFRNMTWPMQTQKPFQIPLLSQPNFSKRMKRWIKRFLRTRKELAIPFHLPKCTIREGAHPKVADALYNPFAWEDYDLLQPKKLPCSCHNTLKNHPELEHIDGHICGTLDQLRLPPDLQILRHINSYSTVFPTKEQYFTEVTKTLQKWLQKHGFPSHDIGTFTTFLQELWTDHLQTMDTTPRLTMDHIHTLKRFLGKDIVIHHADHQNQNARLFCPQLYFQGCANTWQDPQLFTQMTCSPQEALQRVHFLATGALQKSYKWGINWGASLPQGFIFLKGKKQYKKGRTIISYKGPTYAKLLKYAATALEAMLKQVWPQSLGQYSTPEIWKAVHQFFQKCEDETTLHTVNDDLIGFFNSVPQKKLLEAVTVLVRDWCNKFGQEVIQVEVNKKNFHQHNITAGRPNRNNFDTRNFYQIMVRDLPMIVKLSFDSCIFQTLGRIFKQHRGTGIGNQISPVVSNIAVTLIERTWYFCFRTQLDSVYRRYPMIMLRYVDNRFLMYNAELQPCLALRTFAHKFFYEHPVELEDVGSDELLGFDVDAANRTVTYRQPTQSWKIRDVTSAGSWNLRLSGLRSRCVLISRYSWPPTSRRTQMLELIEKYVDKGFSRSRCKDTVPDLLYS